MKTKLLSAIMLLSVCFISAQSSNYRMYGVHEDVVKPSMLAEYEAVAAEFKAVMDKYKGEVEGLAYLCSTTDDMRYSYVWPVEKMADFDQQPIMEVRQKMGAEKFDDMMARMDACYDSHATYTIVLDEELTYMPNGISQTQEGMPYREFHWYYTTPGNMDKLAAKGKEIKALHEKMNSKSEYRVYRSGFGTPEAFFMVAISAKDPVHMAQKLTENQKLLGAAFGKLLNEGYKYTTRFAKKTGAVRADLSVSN